MSHLKRLIAFVLCVITICGCAQNTSAQQNTKRKMHTYSLEEQQELARFLTLEGKCTSNEEQRLLADVVLNRVEDDNYPNTITDVLYQKSQFVFNENQLKNTECTEEALQIVLEEIEHRTNEEVMLYVCQPIKDTGIFGNSLETVEHDGEQITFLKRR